MTAHQIVTTGDDPKDPENHTIRDAPQAPPDRPSESKPVPEPVPEPADTQAGGAS